MNSLGNKYKKKSQCKAIAFHGAAAAFSESAY